MALLVANGRRRMADGKWQGKDEPATHELIGHGIQYT
jgi:hypothetical protein